MDACSKAAIRHSTSELITKGRELSNF